MINDLDPGLKFFFEDPSKSLNFLNINLQIVENNLVFYIYYKPTTSFNFLTDTSCHPPHTKNNILLSLAKFFKNPSKSLNFLNINLQINENNLVFLYYKPTTSFNFSTYTSCHLPHTKNNILLSLAKCIVV